MPALSFARRLAALNASLRARPALWVAACVFIGVWCGSSWAAWLLGSPSAPQAVRAPGLWLPLFPAALLLACAWRCRRHAWRWRASFGAALICAMCACSAWRLTPAPDDISGLARVSSAQLSSAQLSGAPSQAATPSGMSLPGPLKRVPLRVRGLVADASERGEFAQEFPLQIENVEGFPQSRGRVWTRVPLSKRLGVGDQIEVAGELSDLPRAGNWGERDSSARFVLQNCWCRLRAKTANDVTIVRRAAAFPGLRRVESWRAKLLAHYEDAFARLGAPYANATAQLLCAMVFGQGGLQEPLPSRTREEFRGAGLSHLLVASGAQVSFLAALILGGARLLGVRRGALWLLLPALLLYAMLVGGGASIWRATMGGAFVAIALLSGRDLDPMSLWCWALSALLVLDPAQAWSLSLQLTFAATWGLIVLAPVVRRFLAKLAGWRAERAEANRNGPRSLALDVVSLSLGAQFATLPILLYQFGRVSATGASANFLAVPLSGVLVFSGVIGAFSGFLPIARFNYGLTQIIAHVAGFASGGPGARAEVAPLPFRVVFLGALLVYGLALGSPFAATFWADVRAVTSAWWRNTRERSDAAKMCGRWLLCASVTATAWLAWSAFSIRDAGVVTLAMLDVGQGESLVVSGPTGRRVLIDGGTLNASERADVGRSVIVPYLQSVGAAKLDAIILTHDDADHSSGLPAVLREVPVAMLLDGAARGPATPSPEYAAVLNAARQYNVSRVRPRAGQVMDLGGGATLRVLWPPPNLRVDGDKIQSDNERGLVLRLEYGATSMLLTADTGTPTETALLQSGALKPCTVLKVGHHGSAFSTTDKFLNALQPRAAVVSCGRYNPFGHPSPPTMRRLNAHGATVYRTDLSGEITVSCDTRECFVKTFR